MINQKEQQKIISVKEFLFPAQMWLLSRLLIIMAMMVIAPALPAPPGGVTATAGWQVLGGWDGGWYQQIAKQGYEYANDGQPHSIAWFPLLPLLIRVVMSLGLSSEVAGLLVNNIAFLAALLFIYRWVEDRYGISTARWTITALAWCPFSLFGTVIYTEGLFILLSSAALRAFERQQYALTAFWGALATATRPTGIALIPAFLITLGENAVHLLLTLPVLWLVAVYFYICCIAAGVLATR